jgi:two-component system response regulator HydG
MIKSDFNEMTNALSDSIAQGRKSPAAASVLIVDNDPELARFMLEILAGKGIRGDIANDKKNALKLLEKETCGIVFTCDKICHSPNRNTVQNASFELIDEITHNYPEMPVIMITNPVSNNSHYHLKTIPTAVRAIKAGCRDFLVKPLDKQKIENILDTLLPNHSVSTAESACRDLHCLYNIVGKSHELLKTLNLATIIAPTGAPVLISGESGTGKELIAYLIHQKSKRANAPYIKMNCAALADSLLESELFGHEKGAFTGAYIQRKGKFEMAHGGTLLLDEITETPLKFQAKLLRIIEQQDFERVGGNENIKVNVRIISTTNKDLLQEVQLGRFRQDLYYRLCGIRLVLSPLRDRNEDLTELVWHFVNVFARQTQRQITRLDGDMMKIFEKYNWPGNVRQLRNVVLTSLILGSGKTLTLADVSWLFDEIQPLSEIPLNSMNNQIQSQESENDLGGIPLVNVERKAIIDTLRQTDGNQAKAAKVLGISDRTLRDRIKKYKRQGVLQTV